jgi:exonuclease SbcC
MVGKSTILDSIAWALYGYLPKWGGPKGAPVDAVIKRGESSCTVKLTFENQGKTVVVTRSRPNKLAVTVDGEQIHGKTSDLDGRIEQLVGMTPQQFLLSVYISQDRTASFFTMSDTERTQLLSVVAGLDELDKGLSLAKTRRDSIQSSMDKQTGGLSILLEQLNEIPNEMASLTSQAFKIEEELKNQEAGLQEATLSADAEALVIEEDFQRSLGELEDYNKSAQESLKKEKHNLFDQIKKLEASLDSAPRVEPDYEIAIGQAQKALDIAKKQNQERLSLEFKNQKTKQKIQKELDAIDNMADGKCHSCGQSLPTWDREAEIQKHINQANLLSQDLIDVPDEIDIKPFEDSLLKAKVALAERKAQVEAAPNQIKADVQTLTAKFKSVDADIKSLQIDYESKVSTLKTGKEKRLAAASTKKTEIESQIRVLESRRTMSTESIDRLEHREKDLKKKVKAQQDSLRDLESDLSEALDLIEFFGPKGFRSICFNGLIERIGARAGHLLSIMTDGIYSTRVDQVGEDVKGQQKLILRPVIVKGGQEVPQDDLSGGARRMTMLAYDVAIAEAVNEDSPLFLDEALDGLDVMGKTEAMKLLEEAAVTRPVFVIDHSSEFKAAFSNIIKITYKSGNSQLE